MIRFLSVFILYVYMAGNDFIAISRQLFTPWKFEIAGENLPSQIANQYSNHHFSAGELLNFGGCNEFVFPTPD